jgi:molecular chaperone HscB
MAASTATTRRNCWKCGETPPAALVCTHCSAVQPIAPETDLFAVLGLPRELAVDVEDLERRYHAASRTVHPDRYVTAGARELELSVAASAAVNRAYRTLKDPIARGRYWLELHGRRLGDSGPRVPPEIAAEVFETQEKLEELRGARDGAAEALKREVGVLRAAFDDRLNALRDRLARDYEGPETPSLDELRQRLSEIAYLRTLLGDIEDATEEGLRGTNNRH